MTAASLIRRALAAGIEMGIGQDGRLQLRADNPPPASLVTELTAHKADVLATLTAANDPERSRAWLARVARLLDTRPAELLEGGHLDECDLIEQADIDASVIADHIRSSSAWIERPQHTEQTVERATEGYDDQPLHHIETAATAKPQWRNARDLYHNHLFACFACYAPLGRYCETGAQLLALYDATSWS